MTSFEVGINLQMKFGPAMLFCVDAHHGDERQMPLDRTAPQFHTETPETMCRGVAGITVSRSVPKPG